MKSIIDLKKTVDNQQEKFIHTIYHDARNGIGMRVILRDEKKPLIYTTKELDKLKCHDQSQNVYISVATHTSKRRVESQLFNKSVMYIDIDSHGLSASETEDVKENIIRILNHAYASKKIPVPTMVTDSGRGVGIYYCLERSIAVTENTVKQLDFFNRVYQMIYEAYEGIIGDVAQLDHSVLDSSRIVRLPGTTNQKAQKQCRLIYYKDSGYYSLSDLCTSIHKTIAEKRKRDNKKPTEKFTRIINYEGAKNCGFLFLRLNRLKTLAKLRKNKDNGFRELLLFIAYNAAARIYDIKTARKVIYEFNEDFKYALSESEIEHVFRSAEKEGLYNYSDMKIIEKLNITDTENQYCNFGNSYSKDIKRREACERNQNAKKKRNDEIIRLILECPNMTYKEIAKTIEVSEVTVKRIANKLGIYRYDCARKCENRANNIDVISLKKRNDKSKKENIQNDVATINNNNEWTSITNDFSTKVSFCALISNVVPFDENPFLSEEEKEKVFFSWACVTDDVEWRKKLYLIFKRNQGKGSFLYKIYDYINSIKVKKYRNDLDLKVVELIMKNNDIASIELDLNNWWHKHDPNPTRIRITKERSERYKQLIEQKECNSDRFRELEKRFDDTKLAIQVDGIDEKFYWELRRYYFIIFKTANTGRSFYSLRSGCDATGYSVKKKLLSLTSDDFIAIIKRVKEIKHLYHQFSWYLNAFMYVGDNVDSLVS